MYGGGCQLKPLVRSLVRAEAVARAAGVGVVPVLVAWWERRWRTGEPTHNLTNRPKSSAKALPNLDEAANKQVQLNLSGGKKVVFINI